MAEFRRCSNNIEVKNFLPEDTSPAMKPVTKFEEAFHQFPGILSTIRKQASQFVCFGILPHLYILPGFQGSKSDPEPGLAVPS